MIGQVRQPERKPPPVGQTPAAHRHRRSDQMTAHPSADIPGRASEVRPRRGDDQAARPLHIARRSQGPHGRLERSRPVRRPAPEKPGAARPGPRGARHGRTRSSARRHGRPGRCGGRAGSHGRTRGHRRAGGHRAAGGRDRPGRQDGAAEPGRAGHPHRARRGGRGPTRSRDRRLACTRRWRARGHAPLHELPPSQAAGRPQPSGTWAARPPSVRPAGRWQPMSGRIVR